MQQQESDQSASQRRNARKRPRKIWSCLECRRKKLQCDHGLPACGRCSRSGSAASCTYTTVPAATTHAPRPNVPTDTDSIPMRVSSAPSVDTGRLLSRLATLEAKLKELERNTKPTSTDATEQTDLIITPASNAINTPSLTLNDPNNILYRGHAFRTKFNGNTCAASWSVHVVGISDFTKDAFAISSAFDQIQQFLGKSEARIVPSGLQPRTKSDPTALWDLLPSRSVADELLRIYLDSFHLLYPVLFLPIFQEEYTKLWTDSHLVAPQDARPLILALLVMAIANCLISTPLDVLSTNDRQVPRNQATLILDSCESWLNALIQRFDSLIDLQIGFLMLLGRQLNAKRHKRTWAATGGVLRVFMCVGLHRDPEDVCKPPSKPAGLHRDPDDVTSQASKVDMIMRQRLWASIADLDLQAALDHGMSAEPWTQQSDISPPPNVNDDDMANNKPKDVFTASSFLAVAGESVLLRHHLCSTLNDMRQVLSWQKANWYTANLRQCLQDIPQTWTGAGANATRALLALNLHQYILALHEQQLRQPATSQVEKQASRMTLLDSAMQMIRIHKEIYDAENLVVELFYGDHVRAALSICHAFTTTDPLTDSWLITSAQQSACSALEQLLELYTEKVVRSGGSKLHMWLISAAHGLLKTQIEPSKRAAHIEAAIEHFTRPYYRLMALTRDPVPVSQQDTQTGQSSAQPHGSNVAATKPPMFPTDQDLPMMPFGDFAEWTFDDFSFDPADFLGQDNRY